ncbi:hypothetical protein AT251_22665, partial [Enterovibrio nigricans]
GNQKATAAEGFKLDTEVTLLTGSLTDADNDGFVNSAPVFSGTVEVGSTVVVELTNTATSAKQVVNATVGSNGSWTATATGVADGTYTWVAKATDAADNTKELASGSSFTLASSPSSSSRSGVSHQEEEHSLESLESREAPAKILETKVFQGEAKENSEVKLTVEGEKYTTHADEDGDWSIKVEFDQAGEYSYQLSYTGENGHEVIEPGNISVRNISITSDPDIGDNTNGVEAPTQEVSDHSSAQAVVAVGESQPMVDVLSLSTITEKDQL